jgi:hypothetical protein
MKVVGPNSQPVAPAVNPVEINLRTTPMDIKPGQAYSTTLSGINLEKPGGSFVRHIRFPMNDPGVYRVSMTLAGMTAETDVRVRDAAAR